MNPAICKISTLSVDVDWRLLSRTGARYRRLAGTLRRRIPTTRMTVGGPRPLPSLPGRLRIPLQLARNE